MNDINKPCIWKIQKRLRLTDGAYVDTPYYTNGCAYSEHSRESIVKDMLENSGYKHCPYCGSVLKIEQGASV